ncbi:MAG: GNAT family N-acetyltransferase [bacterium]|nr:GNAT family N-acetyltransferase [bacterium]
MKNDIEVQIRDSVPNDVYGIREVQRKTWFETYPNEEEGITIEDVASKFDADKTQEGQRKIEEKKARYTDKNRHTWVATAGEEIVGFCAAEKGEKNNRLSAVYVLPTFQGRGIGKMLIAKVFAWLGNDKAILVNVARYNQKAIGFYQKFGFMKTGKTLTDESGKLPTGKVILETELIKPVASS